MRTIVCETPNRFKLIRTERPTIRQGEALVRIRRVGVCGTDLHAYGGRQPYFTYPRILGHELSGIVEAIADPAASTGIRAGDPVCILPYVACGQCRSCRLGKPNCCVRLEVIGVHRDGGMRDYLAVPLAQLVPVPSISLDAAAIVECLGIGAHAVRRASMSRGETALVIGAGPIGLGVMKFLHLAGMRVIAMDVNERRLAFCKQWSPADDTVNAAEQPMERLLELTGGELADVVFDATGNAKSMEGAFDYAAHGGKVVYVSLVRDNITFSDPDFHKKEMTLLSSRNATREDFETVIRAMEAGQVDTESFITHRAPFEAMIGEFDAWLKPDTGVIKAMVEL